MRRGRTGGGADELADDRIAGILRTLDRAAEGDASARLPADTGGDEVLWALHRRINDLIEERAEAQREKAEYQRELERNLATIEQQRAAILELSTPVIELWEGALCLPIVGVLDTARSAEMTDALMRAVVEKQARFAIIDVTGIESMDTSTADHFIRMAKAVRLLGAHCVLSGISPQIAQTIIHMGVDLAGLATHRSVRDALRQYIVEHRAFLPEAKRQAGAGRRQT